MAGQLKRPEFGADLEKGPLLPKEEARLAPAERKVLGLPVTAVAGICYCTASASMVLLNKAALSSFSFHSPTCLLFFQCLVCVILVKTAHLLGHIRLEPFSVKIVKVWFPVNLIFVGMIWTSFFALKLLGVPMATVLKNLTNLFVIAGDYLFYGKTYGTAVWLTLLLMGISAVCGAFTDLAFNLEGYIWQLINCLFTAAYSLYLRGVMDKVVPLTVNKTKLDEFSMVFYNNLLSLPLIFGLIIIYGEQNTIMNEPALWNPYFQFAALISALVGFCISFASLWFLSTTTPTTFSLVGSLNKIPVALIGLVAFNTPWNVENVASVLVGLASGAIFVKAKSAGR